MSDIIIGILLVISFFFMVWYCVKGYNLMVGFAIMATVWMGLALVGNTLSPNPAMEGQGVIDVLTHIYTTGPAEYAKSILVNVFFGAFFGRVLVDSGIAATLIRKVVELGGDKPRITMSLLCVVTAVIFMSMTGIGPVISIAVIVLPILMSLGISVPVALFSFMGSIMAGIFANIVNFKQYQTIYAGFNPAAESYTYNDYFQIGMIGMVVSLVVVLTVANISMNKKKRYAMAANVPAEGGDAPMISWLAVLLPVLGVVLLDLPIILGFILAGIWALLFTGKLRGGYKEICRQFAKLFTDGAVDVAPMVGFLMTLAMFNNSAAYASPYFSAIFGDLIPQSPLVLAIVFAIFDTTRIFPRSNESSRFRISYFSCCISCKPNNVASLFVPIVCNHNDCPSAFRYYTILGRLGIRVYKSNVSRVHEEIHPNWLDHRCDLMFDYILLVRERLVNKTSIEMIR